MATPIGHSLLGYTIYHASSKSKINWKVLFFFIFVANLADIDYLFGFVVGRPNAFHHQFTHSISLSIIVGLAAALFYKIKGWEKFSKIFALISLTYFSHVLVDFFTLDTSVPFGEQLLWPFSQEYYISPVTIFRDVHKADTSGAFFAAIFSWYNFWTAISELLIFGFILSAVHYFKRKFKYKKS